MGRSTAVAVILEGVDKTYYTPGGPLAAVDDVALAVRPAEFLAVVGPSGCGKSTLLMLIAGLIMPTRGFVAVDGRKVTRPFTDVGFVFQKDALLEWRNVLANVLLPAEIKRLPPAPHRARALELLGRVGLAGFEHRYPYELSGGMRQRVALCRALVHDPPLLLMDEPFAALDAFTREELGFYVLRLWEARRSTVIFVTHAIEEAVILADRVVVLAPRPGRVLATVDIPLPRPRLPAMKDDDRSHAAVRQIRDILVAQGLLAPERTAEGSLVTKHASG